MEGVSEFYEIGEDLGGGTYGAVYKCRNKNNGQLVAIRITATNGSIEVPHTTLRELGILKEMNHPNIVQLQDVMHAEIFVYTIFEFLQTNLEVFMDKYQNIVRNPAERRILLGVAYCHENGIIHGNLKPSNLFIDESHKILKLADFGLARALGISKGLSNAESPLYHAPEILLDCHRYSKAADMWSVGAIFAEMVLLERLFFGHTPTILLGYIFRLLGTPNEETWPGVTELLEADFFPNYPPMNLQEKFAQLEPTGVDLLSKMLCLNPSQRITAHKALEHEYFNAEDSSGGSAVS